MSEVIITAIVSIVTGLAGFVFGKRKNNAEANSTELENVQMAIKIWREEAERLDVKVHLLEDHLNLLKDENNKLKCEIDRLSKEVDRLTVCNRKRNPKPKNHENTKKEHHPGADHGADGV